MSRSTYIYVVQSDEGQVLGAFTVKRELAERLERHPELGLVTVTRTRDGNLGDDAQCVELNRWTLEPER